MVKNQLASAGDTRDRGLIPESGRSPGRWDGNPPPVFMPGEPQRERSLVDCSPWGHKELDMTKQLTLSLSLFLH